jgi:hypothetical protein
MKNRSWIAGLGCAIAVLLCIVAINPRAEIGLNDDWSYIFTAKRLAETGHVIYNGWATAILGVQLYPAALFIHLFGFSFTAVRATSMCLAVLSGFLSYELMTWCGIRPKLAAFGTLTLTLSPLFLGLATTFMTDANALFFILLFFYACVRCDLAQSQRAEVTWLVVAALAGLAGGSVRQIAFLCNLAAFPGLVWHLRKRFGLLIPGAVLWIVSVASVFLIVHWFNHQPYTSIEKPYFLPKLHGELVHIFLPRIIMSVVSTLALLTPVLLMLALKFPTRGRKQFVRAGSMFAAIVLVVGVVSLWRGGDWWGLWLIGSYVAINGRAAESFIIGPHIPAASNGMQVVLAMFLIGITFFAAATIRHFYKKQHSVVMTDVDWTLVWTALPFVAGYLLLVFTRFTTFDRYFLPMVFVVILFALRWFERHFDDGPSWPSVVMLVLVAVYGVANTHDIFASARAHLGVINELRAAGVPRNEIRDGFEFDGWTEIEQVGYVNEPRIHPAADYHLVAVPFALEHLRPPETSAKKCYSFFYTYTPAVHAHYVLQSKPNFCFATTDIRPVPIKSWLPPYDTAIYAGAVPEEFR